MTIAVIDGIGGGIGVQIVERLRKEGLHEVSILALGANAIATQRMVDAGADRGASGENAIRVSVSSTDYNRRSHWHCAS
jgi:NAD(P)-dependent dehydrogenase (short-subunit alcohol dehydrogenase family)